MLARTTPGAPCDKPSPLRRTEQKTVGLRIAQRWALCCAGLLLAATCIAAAQPVERTLRIAMLADVETLDPARAPELGTIYTIAPLYHQLLTYDYSARRATLIPYAAAALPKISADGAPTR